MTLGSRVNFKRDDFGINITHAFLPARPFNYSNNICLGVMKRSTLQKEFARDVYNPKLFTDIIFVIAN